MPESRLAVITFVDGGAPDNSLPGFPGYPSNGLPSSPGRPDNSLPPGTGWLPVFPFDPTIDNSLPGQPGYPSTGPIRPGLKFVVKWLACTGLILVPDNSLPDGPPARPSRPDNTLPGTPTYPGNELPATPEPK